MGDFRWRCSGRERLLDTFQREKRQLLLCLCAVFLWGLVAHGYGFLHCSLSHDALNAFIASENEDFWKVCVGRFFSPLYRSLLRGSVAAPWLLGLLGLVWVAAAVYLVCRIFRVQSPVLTVLIAGIMTTNLSFISQVATYFHEFDINAFALLLAVAAVFLWSARRGWGWSVLGCLCLYGSMGLYQGFVALAITLMIARCLGDLLEKKTAKEVFLHGLRGILLLLAAGALYTGTMKLFNAYGFRLMDRTNPLSTGDQSPVRLYLGLVKPALAHLGKNLFHPAYGSNRLGPVSLVLTALLLLTTGLHCWRQRYGATRFLLALPLLALLPLAMGCMYIVGKGSGIHEIMLYSAWFFYVFLLLLGFRLVSLRDTFWNRGLRAACCLLVGWLLWQNVVIANTAYVRKEREAQADLSTMTRVVATMEQREDYVYAETPIAFIGARQNPEEWYGAEGLSKITGLQLRSSIFTDSYTEYFNTYQAYFSYVLQYEVNYCDMETHQRLKKDPRVERMPAYPEKGYMQMLDGVLVIKMAP